MAVHALTDIETDPAALSTLGLELPEVADDPKYLNSRVSANGLVCEVRR